MRCPRGAPGGNAADWEQEQKMQLHDLTGHDPIERARLARENMRIAFANLRESLTELIAVLPGAAAAAPEIERLQAEEALLLAKLAELGEEPEPDGDPSPAGPAQVAVLKEDLFLGHGLRRPWVFLYTCIGPDGHRFENRSIKTLRDQLRRRYGKVTVTVVDLTASARGADPSHIN